MPSPQPSGLARAGSSFLGVFLGVLFAIVGFVLMVGAVMLGLLVAGGALLWALIRGKRPGPVRFEWRQATARARRPGSGRPPADEVVDVEMREIPEDRSRPQDGGPDRGH
jgi:hypothetical protein